MEIHSRRTPRWLPAAQGGLLLAALLAAVWYWATRERALPPVGVEKVDVALVSGTSGVLSQEDVQRLFQEEVQRSGSFSLSDPGGVRLSLELALSRQAPEEGTEAPPLVAVDAVEAIADVTVARRREEVTERLVGTGRGASSGPAAVRDATTQAMAEGLAEAAAIARAWDKSNAALEEDAKTGATGAQRRAAVTVLSDRSHPAATDFLLAQLRDPDIAVVRRAIGGLVRLHERRAVPVLIELGRGRGPGFQREILYAVAEIGGEEAEAYLFTVAEGHEDATLREAAKQALEAVGKRPHREGDSKP